MSTWAGGVQAMGGGWQVRTWPFLGPAPGFQFFPSAPSPSPVPSFFFPLSHSIFSSSLHPTLFFFSSLLLPLFLFSHPHLNLLLFLP